MHISSKNIDKYSQWKAGSQWAKAQVGGISSMSVQTTETTRSKMIRKRPTSMYENLGKYESKDENEKILRNLKNVATK